MFRRNVCLLATLLLIGIALGAPRRAGAGGPPMPPCVPGEVLMGMKKDAAVTAQALTASFAQIAGVQPALNAYRIQLKPGVNIQQAINYLKVQPGVAYTEPNYILQAFSTPNDAFYLTKQYAPQITKTDLAWNIWSPSAPMVIAIVDTGVQPDHPDLINKVLPGHNSITNTSNSADDHGHGTHCAGIAAAQSDNGIGIAGVAGWNGAAGSTDATNIKILPVKVLGSNGSGALSTVADGITWAVDHGANVISLSLGSTATSGTLDSAIQYAWSNGCVVVGAAGNSSTNFPSYPGASANVLSVAATDSTDTLTGFSNFGTWVKVAAPGLNIYSTLPGSSYGSLSGTSMACPFVAGEAALIWSQVPTLTNAQVVSIITKNVDPYLPYAGHTIAAGAGRVNVYQALYAAINPNDPLPASLSIAPTTIWGGDTATGTITLTAPAPAGGATVALSSSAIAVAGVPTTVTVPAGSSSATFPVTGQNVTTIGNAVLTATLSTVTKTAGVTVKPLLASVTLSPAAVKGGVSASGVVALNGLAPSGGEVIALSSSDPSATVPSSVTVKAGATFATFPITTSAVTTDTSVTITAAHAGITKTAPLTVKAPALVAVALNPATVSDSAASTGTVTLDGIAPSGGATVTLSSSDTNSATVPMNVVVAAGKTTATFTVNTSVVTTKTTVTISALFSGVTKTATLTINPLLSSLSVTPASVKGGVNSAGLVVLNAPAPAGGKAIALSSSDASATVPSTVTVKAGATFASFPITTSAVTTDTSVTITAAHAGITKTAPLTVKAPALTAFALNPSLVADGMAAIGTVTLDSIAPASGMSVSLSSSDTTTATVPASITVPAGKTTATFTVSSVAVTTTKTVTITTTCGGVSKTATLTVKPLLANLTLSPASVKGGSTATGTVTLNVAAPAGGKAIPLSSDNAAAKVPGSVTVPAGATSATFTITTTPVTTDANATIKASYAGVSKTAPLTVKAPQLATCTIVPTKVKGGDSAYGTITLDGPAPTGGVTILLDSTVASGGTLPVSIPTSVIIPEGSSQASGTITTQGVVADTSVTIKATLGSVSKTAPLIVLAPALVKLDINPGTIPNGGTSTGTVTLDGIAPTGGLSVALSSNNPHVQVPSSVSVSGGSKTATFSIVAANVNGPETATITATYNGVNQFAQIQVNPWVASLTLNPSAVADGASSTGTVTLSFAAPATGAVVGLGSSDPTTASVPMTVTVPPGQKTATFLITTTAVTTLHNVFIGAFYNSSGQTASLTVSPMLSSLTVSPAGVKCGGTVTGTVTLGVSAPQGGVSIALSSSDPAAVVPSMVVVPFSAKTVSFTITTTAVTTNTDVTITASHAGINATAPLTVVAGQLTSITVAPGNVRGGVQVTGMVTLDGIAPGNGATVQLSSSDTGVASVPLSVTVPAGKKTATFTFTPFGVSQVENVTLSATYSGVTKTANLTVTPALLIGFSVSPALVTDGQTATGMLLLDGIAPTDNASISLTSSDPSVSVPDSVLIPSGSKSVSFPINTAIVTASKTVMLKATYLGVGKVATLVNSPLLANLTVSPGSVKGGANVTGAITLTAMAPPGGVVIPLSSNDPSASVPASVTVPAGAAFLTFPITTTPVAGDVIVAISANHSGLTKTANLKVAAPVPLLLTISPTKVKGGVSATGIVLLDSAAPSGGLTVTLTSSDTNVATVPTTVTVPAGAKTASFILTTLSVTVNKAVTITANTTATAKAAASLTVTP